MLTLDEIVGAARDATRLPDPDRDTWQEGLGILLRDHARSQLLTERGEQRLKGRYVGALANRMRVDEHLRQHPEVLETPIKRPVIILGLVRTGTTMTSYLMDADPANRSMLRWEANNVAPPAAPAGDGQTAPGRYLQPVLRRPYAGPYRSVKKGLPLAGG